MTMFYRQVGDAIKLTLANAEAGRYRTIGYQKQTRSAEEVKKLRIVQVYFANGDFSKSSGSINGPINHNMTFGVQLMVAVPAKADLATLDDGLSTQGQVSAALIGAHESSEVADQLMDELIDIIWQELMDARNQDFYQADPTLENKISNRWIDSVRKGEPEPKGSLLTLTASMNLSLSAQETVVGASTATGLEGVDTIINQDGDPNNNTGINVVTTP